MITRFNIEGIIFAGRRHFFMTRRLLSKIIILAVFLLLLLTLEFFGGHSSLVQSGQYSVLVLGKGAGFIVGVIVVVLFFIFPRFIERYDFFSIRHRFQHDGPNSQSTDTNTRHPRT